MFSARRMLHVTKQAPWQRPLVAWLQRTLREGELGKVFFRNLATPKVGYNAGSLVGREAGFGGVQASWQGVLAQPDHTKGTFLGSGQ